MVKTILAIASGSYIGGAEKVTLDVLSGLKDKNFEIHCIVNGWNDDDFPSRLRKLNISYTPVKLGWYYIHKIKWSLDSLFHYPNALLTFLRIKNSFKHDFIYLTSFRPIILLYPFLKKNIVYHVHDPNTGRQSRTFLKVANKKVLKFIAVSEFIKNDLISCGINKNKIDTVYNGINIPDPKEEKFENDKFLTVGLIGQVIPRKGHEDVLSAFKILKNKGYNSLKLKIVGKGDKHFEEKLKSLIKSMSIDDIIIWKGYEKEMANIYRGIDVVIAPSRTEEPFGLIAIEANAMNIPVIVSRKGGLVEIVIDNFNGFLVDAFSPAQIAEKILLFYNQPLLIKKMGENGRKRVIKNFSKSEMNEKIANTLNTLSNPDS